ncbi:ATPase [Virgisporangium aliadipatigenens]|uniref:histidine kinase n=1 Tax=Virgisporangium aliadipatigenens TaxID=741659 RepID=A0A8J4DPP6_9ACTN|nr:sensor histidine kinase [Virgisporangium aliadipatigenens]GIJ46180.1 ATPase [Virgisporangium aliadipatigenens]
MRRRMSLAGQLLLFQLGVVLLVVVAVGAVSLAEANAAFRTDEGRRLRSIAENLAAESTVRTGLTDAVWRETLAARAENARAVSGATYVMIGDRRGVLVTGPNAGRPADLGDSDVRRGRSWVGVLDDGARRLVAHAPVLAEPDGAIVGFVIVGLTFPTFAGQLANATPGLLVYLTLGLALGVTGSLLLARRVKRQTLGLEPAEITGLVEHREAMLHGIKEGVIGIDPAGRVTLANDEAIRLLGLRPDAVGQPLSGQRLPAGVCDVLTGRIAGADQVVLREDRVLVLNRMPVIVRGREVGSVTTLRDRTELTALRRELDLSRNTTDTLRAQAHEFTNRLHTIAGLVQLGEYDEVVRFVDRTSRQQEDLRHVTSRIGDPAVAALLVAKASLAAEHGVDLRIDPDAAIGPLAEPLSAELVTVVGNLVDNALDAAGAGGWVSVSLVDGDEIVVSVCDSGAGVPPERSDDVFLRGFSTKDAPGGARGFGLALTRSICVRHGGSATVDGAAFTARIPRTPAAARR